MIGRQPNQKNFDDAMESTAGDLLYLALDLGHEIRVVMNDEVAFRRWLWQEQRTAGITIVLTVLNAPATALYFSVEDFLSATATNEAAQKPRPA